MTTLVATLAALGLLLVYDGLAREPVRRSRIAGPLRRLATESGINGLTPARLVAACAAAIVISLVVTAGATGSLVIALAIALPAGAAPVSFVRHRRDARRRRLREEWPDALASLIAGVRAGMSLPECCAALAERGPAALAPGARAFTATYHATGSFDAALTRLQDELADPIADRVATALRLAADVGGTDLVRVLRTLADFLREDVRVRKEIEARWSWTVTAARVAAAAPWIVLLLMATRPEAARAYESAAGATVIGAGAAATFAGYRLMLRAARLPEERRAA
ncbi:MAG TPA: type II secretion system F family protein [Actinomycetota bacterium]|nr:type II secretion system F family protein [Actinomycetota bacterium]